MDLYPQGIGPNNIATKTGRNGMEGWGLEFSDLEKKNTGSLANKHEAMIKLFYKLEIPI